MKDKIVVMDFLAPDVPMLATRILETGVDCEIVSSETTASEINALGNVKGIVLSGSPKSIMKSDALFIDRGIYKLGIPILGICYGMELMMHDLGGEVTHRKTPEKGRFKLTVLKDSKLFKNTPVEQTVFMNHSEQDRTLPKDFKTLAFTKSCKEAATENSKKDFYGVQFHPEKIDSVAGQQILRNFVYDICGVTID